MSFCCDYCINCLRENPVHSLFQKTSWPNQSHKIALQLTLTDMTQVIMAWLGLDCLAKYLGSQYHAAIDHLYVPSQTPFTC